MVNIKTHLNSREIAYLAVLESMRGSRFASEVLEEWRDVQQPDAKDFSLAHEIAYGSIRMAYTLDEYARQLAGKPKKLTLKPKERALVRTALFQNLFLSRIPVYALADESIDIAKKYCHPTFVAFFNAILRNLNQKNLALPKGINAQELSIIYSYPIYYIDLLLQTYGLKQVEGILKAGNIPGCTTVRVRGEELSSMTPYLQPLDPSMFGVKKITNPVVIPQISKSSSYYIQNLTPVALMYFLKADQKEFTPSRVLDFCAAPGGKLLLAHDFFPNAILNGNDVSAEKIKKLHENCLKYQLNVKITISSDETFASEHQYDLIILDVPCSNTGVLNKRPEARWRLTEENLNSLQLQQKNILAHAVRFLAHGGKIWYLTCSILQEENQHMARWATENLGLKIKSEKTILPDFSGNDGGYCACLEPQ